MQELDDYINKVKHLPPAPRVLPELLALLGREDIDSSRVVDLIAFDPALTVSVLQLCNSALFAAGTPVTDLHEAVTRLGFSEVYRIVAAVVGSRTMKTAPKGYGIQQGELWQHAVTSAVAAQLIARRLGDDESTVFTAALLHDVGKIILSEALEHIYEKLVKETETNQAALLETEKKLLGVQHAEVGGRLLARWKFPANLVAAVWWHHSPQHASPHERLASFVYLGNMVAYFMGHGYGHAAFALRGRAEALNILQISPESLPHFMMETFEQLELVKTLFSAGRTP
jgi:putative nucleotidyltransferase with HDIG domain